MFRACLLWTRYYSRYLVDVNEQEKRFLMVLTFWREETRELLDT